MGNLILIFLATMFHNETVFSAIPAPQKTLDIYAVSPVHPDSIDIPKIAEQIIPTDLNEESTNDDFVKKTGRKVLRAITKSDFIKKSVLGKTADNIKESTSTETSVTPSSDPESIEHKFKFSADPYKGVVKLRYSGIINCNANYDAFDNDLSIEVSEQFEETSISFKHSTVNKNSYLLLGWSW